MKQQQSNTALKWQDHGPITLDYHWYTAPAAQGFYIINPTFTQPSEFNKTGFIGYHVAHHVGGLRTRDICGVVGRGAVMEVAEAKTAAQADHDAGRDR